MTFVVTDGNEHQFGTDSQGNERDNSANSHFPTALAREFWGWGKRGSSMGDKVIHSFGNK